MIKTIFYVLSILVIAAAAYFAFDVKKKLEGEIATYGERRGSNEQVAADIKKTEGSLADVKGSLGKAKTLGAELTATQGNEESKTGGYRASIQKAESDIEDYGKEMIQFDQVRKQVEMALGGVGLELDEIPAEITKLEDKRKEQQRELERLIDLEAKIARDVTSNKAEVISLNDRLVDLRAKISQGAQQGVVTAVDPTWGFVVVNQGAGNSNVTERSEFLVSRRGRVLGRLQVTSLEPNRAICDIDPDSFRPGVRVQTGDRVTLADTATN